MSRRILNPAPSRPELDALLKKTANHKMTKEEIAVQRKSWVIGEMMIENPEMTREYVEKIYEEVL